MMLVKMLSTRKGSPDGIQTVIYTQGQSYEVSGELLDVFLREGWCEAAEPFREEEDNGSAERARPAAEGLASDAVGTATEEAKELVAGEADVLAKYTRDELLDLAEEQGVEVPSDITKKADVVKFLAGKLKVTVE
jgi:hypothetical protein